jgi:hypothetical protein
MSMQDEPDGNLSSEEEAELRAFRRIASALEQGDITNWPPRSDRYPIRCGPGRNTMRGEEK